MQRGLNLIIIYCATLLVISGCSLTKRGMLENNTYFSNQNPSVQIALGENYEYYKGGRGQYQHQFSDQENHRMAFVHVFLHDANQTQVDYYNNPEGWIYSTPHNSVELNRFVTEMIGEKWYVQDVVYHPSTAACVLIRDLSVFTDTHDVFKFRYFWEIPPYKCENWKTVASLSPLEGEYFNKFVAAFSSDVTIRAFHDPENVSPASGELPQIQQANAILSVPALQQPLKLNNFPEAHDSREIKNVAIFPWVLDGESDSFLGLLKESIMRNLEASDELKLERSYYKIKKVGKLNVSGYMDFYTNNSPNIDLVRQVAAEEGIQIAVLGRMNINCKWSDECHVRAMETILVDVLTGDVETIHGASSSLDARDVVDMTVTKTFKKYIGEI